jgi:hypothetical protein
VAAEDSAVGELAEAEQVQGGDGVGGGEGQLGVRGDALQGRGHAVAAGVALGLRIPETLVLLLLQRRRELEPLHVLRRLEEVEEALDQERVILRQCFDAGLAVGPAALERLRLRVPERGGHEARGAVGGVEVTRLAECGTGAGERGDDQTVPARQDLVVA